MNVASLGDYASFIATKARAAHSLGFDVEPAELHPRLFDFQRTIVSRMLKLGRGAIFASTGLGKTGMQICFADRVYRETGRNVLILAPLAVASQTVREAELFGVSVTLCRENEDVRPGINITNYDRFERFGLSQFSGIVLDESSILKAQDGKTRTALISLCQRIPYRLACTATPAPNDVMELGNHAEFLGIMTGPEMLATYFVHDGGETQKWRLKGHAEKAFWRWVASWASIVHLPSDLGFKDESYALPPLRYHEHVLDAPALVNGDTLFALPASSLTERRDARKVSINDRVWRAAEIVANEPGPWLVWCGLNAEANAFRAVVPSTVEVRGSDDPDYKTEQLLAFADGKVDVLLSKPSIAGFGLNLQVCHKMIFLGISDSWEQLYQAIRRCWRFGQTNPVDVHLILSSAEIRVLENLKRKERDAEKMRHAMAREAAAYVSDLRVSAHYSLPVVEVPAWLQTA